MALLIKSRAETMKLFPFAFRNALCALGFLLLTLTGCSSTRNTATLPDDASQANVDQRLRLAVERWHGTPYRLGGTQQNGIDCSGFTQALFDEVFGLRLPRTTLDQVKEGEPVERSELVEGDLVFFQLPQKGRHVGVYLSRGEFAHASTSEGVTVTPLAAPYWRDRYWTARRLLDLPAGIEAPVSAAPRMTLPAPERQKPAARVGW